MSLNVAWFSVLTYGVFSGIIIAFTEATDLAGLEVLFNGDAIKAEPRTAKRTVDTSHEWTLECDMCVIFLSRL